MKKRDLNFEKNIAGKNSLNFGLKARGKNNTPDCLHCDRARLRRCVAAGVELINVAAWMMNNNLIFMGVSVIPSYSHFVDFWVVHLLHPLGSRLVPRRPLGSLIFGV